MADFNEALYSEGSLTVGSFYLLLHSWFLLLTALHTMDYPKNNNKQTKIKALVVHGATSSHIIMFKVATAEMVYGFAPCF